MAEIYIRVNRAVDAMKGQIKSLQYVFQPLALGEVAQDKKRQARQGHVTHLPHLP